MDRLNPVVLTQNMGYLSAREVFRPSALKKKESLPFTIKVASNLDELGMAVEMRRKAYGRHLPEFAETMEIEPIDKMPGSIVLLAQSRLDGGALGTLRVQTNEFGRLAMEQSLVLPEWLTHGRLAEATRLGVAGGVIGRLVKVALCKAFFMYCAQEEVDWMLITARSPLDREYEAMLFTDVYGQNEFVPMAHVGNMPHRVMAKPLASSVERWKAANHPLYGFFCETDHADIDVRVPESQSVAV